MKIEKASRKDAEEVYAVIKEAVLAFYPKYYPPAVTAWFANDLHSMEHTAAQIAAGQVYVLRGARIVGTVCVKEDCVAGLYVLPGYGRRGFGSQLLHHAERLAAKHGGVVRVDSSAPAEQFYLRRGYTETGEGSAEIYGEHLTWKKMEKRLQKE